MSMNALARSRASRTLFISSIFCTRSWCAAVDGADVKDVEDEAGAPPAPDGEGEADEEQHDIVEAVLDGSGVR